MMFPKQKFYKRPKSAKVEMPEKEIQSKCEEYLNDIGYQYIHIPDILQQYLRHRAPPHIAKISSMAFKGMPDLIVLHPSGKYLLLELKTEINKETQSQINWSKGLNLVVSHGLDESLKILKDFCENN